MNMRCWILAGAILLSACAPAIYPRQAIFNESEYAPYKGVGTAIVYGEAFLLTRGGDVKKGAGARIYLSPVTSYSTEFFQRSVLAGQRLEDPDPRVVPYVRTTIADSEGKFEFSDVPAGTFYLYCWIVWEVPIGYGNTMPTGGAAGTQIQLKSADRTRVILTR